MLTLITVLEVKSTLDLLLQKSKQRWTHCFKIQNNVNLITVSEVKARLGLLVFALFCLCCCCFFVISQSIAGPDSRKQVIVPREIDLPPPKMNSHYMLQCFRNNEALCDSPTASKSN